MSPARLLAPLFAVGFALALAGAAQPPKDPPAKDKDDKQSPVKNNRNVRWGMPAAAAVDPTNKDAYLIARQQYVISYSAKKNSANWSCWNLVKADIGRTARGAFEEDPDLPKEFTRVQFNTYTGSGFDRGHLCPSKDRSATEADNDAVFFMTNIIPQSPACNQKGWERLESYCRDLADQGKDLYIACGGHGVGGFTDDNVKKITIGRNAPFVTVPAHVWKVILVLPNRIAGPTKETRVIAVWMPNDPTVTDDWPKYRVSVADIEKKTGLDFFPAVADETAKAIKEKPDDVKVVVPPR